MKIVVIVLLVCVSFNSYSQNLKVEYEIFVDGDFKFKTPADLLINLNNFTSFYILKPSKSINLDVLSSESSDTFNYITKQDDVLNKYDIKNNLYYTFEPIGSTIYQVVDTLPNIEWITEKETKEVDGIKLIKASCLFRGRKWIAWYSPDTPINYGPWKFHGLPGVIIEIYDESNKFQIKALKITETKDVFSYEIKKYEEKERGKHKLTLKQHLDLHKEYSDAVFTEIAERDNFTRFEVKRQGYELIYEWEEEAKKE